MTWNYRVILKDEIYQIHSVYYEGEQIVGVSEGPSLPVGESFAEFGRALQKYFAAITKPVLAYNDLVKQEPTNENKAD